MGFRIRLNLINPNNHGSDDMKSLLFPLLIILSIISASTRANAQTLWTQTNGPQGGSLTTVCIDSTRHLLIGTEAGGIFESSDRGDQWFPRNAGLPSLHIRELESSAAGYIYATTTDAGIFRYQRTDQSHWISLDSTFSFGAIYAMAAAPNGHVFIGTARYGVLRSKDNGNSWDAPDIGLDAADIDIRQLTVSSDGHLLALTVTQNTYHLYSSTDDGGHWQKLLLSPSSATPLALLALPNGTIFTGDLLGRVFRSSDNGADWQTVYSDSGHYGIYNLIRSPQNGHLFLHTNFGDFLRSTDSGTSWVKISSDTIGGSQYPTAIDDEGTIYAGTDFEGMLRSEDEGVTFVIINEQLVANLVYQVAVSQQSIIYALTEDLAFRTTDSGNTWKRLNFAIGEELVQPAIAIDSMGTVYIGTIDGIFVSSDSGNTWSNPVGPPLHQTSDQCYAIAAVQGDAVFAATEFGLVTSKDHGQTWSNVTGPVDSINMVGFVAGRNGMLYATDGIGTLYRSTDQGDSWEVAASSSDGVAAVSPEGLFFRVPDSHIYRSSDSAETWQQLPVPDSLHSRTVWSILLDNQNNLLASTDSGVYRSSDMGTTWASVSTGLQDPSATRLSAVTRLAQDPKNGMFYAASRGQGVFRSLPYLTSGVKKEQAAGTPPATRLEQNYPNPFYSSTTIPFMLAEASSVRLEVHDVLGNIIWSRDIPHLEAGNYSAAFSNEDIPSGAYLCVLKTESGVVSKWMTVVR
jgi:photosystem II stability/assembly factor-like uncharacterized protein